MSMTGAATAFPDATDAATEILRAGGNAIDAAVAAAWALSVCEPGGSGLGGQTTMLIHFADGTDRVVDGHSYAPAAASENSITPEQQRLGHRACTIPSTPATLAHAQREYGILPASRVIEPAIRIAEQGFTVTPLQSLGTASVRDDLAANEAAARFFLRDGQPPRPGLVLRQPVLARTLRRIAAEGVEDFYCGQMARAIVADMEAHGGLVTAQDLSSLAVPVEREPMAGLYRGLRVVTVPPPGGGWQLLLALRVLEVLFATRNPADDEWYEAIAVAVYASFREYDRSVAWTIDESEAADVPARDVGDTTHLNVADRDGNVVALTQSLQSVFGAKVANPTLGFVYNNALCTSPRGSSPDRLAPGCTPRSNAAPTLILEGDAPRLAIGAAGSRRITSSILQVISGVFDRHRRVDAAVGAPRVHARQSGSVWLEREAADSEILARLQAQFSRIELKSRQNYKLGCVQALLWAPDGTLTAAADPRRDGTARSFQEGFLRQCM